MPQWVAMHPTCCNASNDYAEAGFPNLAPISWPSRRSKSGSSLQPSFLMFLGVQVLHVGSVLEHFGGISLKGVWQVLVTLRMSKVACKF